MEKLPTAERGPIAMMRRLPLFFATVLMTATTLVAAGEPVAPTSQPLLN